MESLKPHIGTKSKQFREEITASRIAAFCKAVHAPVNEKAPPTFLTSFRHGEFDIFKEIGVSLSSILHGEQEYQYQDSILANDIITYTTTLAHVLAKSGNTAKLQILTLETEFIAERNQQKFPVGKARSTMVVRSQI